MTGGIAALPLSGVLIGVDHIHLDEFTRCLTVGGERMRQRVYTPDELVYAADRPDRLAARFAAKEASLKMLGTGVRGISLREVEVIHLADGRPTLRLHARARTRAANVGLAGWDITLSHTSTSAMAVAIGWTWHAREARP